MNYPELVEEMRRMISVIWEFLIELVPKLIIGLIVLLLGYFLARIIQALVGRFIGYLDRIINNSLKSRLLQINLSSSRTFIARTFFWIIIFFFVTLFTEIIGLPVITSWLAGLGEYLPNILAGIVILFFGIIFSRLVADLIKNASFASRISDPQTLAKVSRYVILVMSIIIAINQIGIDISFLTHILYILLAVLLLGAALAFGLGARTSVSNILASYYISRTYAEGNLIRIGEHEGRIIKITSTSVFLETDSGQVIIPAKEFNEQKSILIEKK
jgi:small-conductance mechanosensitive channel